MGTCCKGVVHSRRFQFVVIIIQLHLQSNLRLLQIIGKKNNIHSRKIRGVCGD
jgi:hypothetical protein